MAQLYTSSPERSVKSDRIDPTAFRQKLARRAHVSNEEASVLLDLLGPERLHAAGDIIVQPDTRAHASSLLVSGFAGRTSGMKSGAEAITQIAIPGDFIDLNSFLTLQTDQGVVAFTACRTRSFDHSDLADAIDAQPRLARLLWLESVVDSAVQREWLFRMGRQDALGRMAHFICELQARLDVVGLDGEQFDVPLTQSQLADILGLSVVHVSRTISALRSRGVIEWSGGAIEIRDLPGLRKLAEFDPSYLRIGLGKV